MFNLGILGEQVRTGGVDLGGSTFAICGESQLLEGLEK